MSPRRQPRTPSRRSRAPEGPEPVDVRLLRADDLLVARVTAPGCHLEDSPSGPVLVADTDPASLVLHLPPQHVGERAWQVQPKETLNRPSGHRAAEPSRIVFALPVGTQVPFTVEGILTALPTLSLRVVPLATPRPTRGAGVQPRPSWADAVLVDNWQQLVKAGQGNLADVVFGVDRTTAQAATTLSSLAAGVLQHAQAGRLVGGFVRQTGTAGSRASSGAGVAESDLRTGLFDRLRPGFGPILRPRRGGPRAPTDGETSIEAPYRVQVSPSDYGAFVSDPKPVVAPQDSMRTELWRTRLSVRVTDADGAFVRVDDDDENQRIVRAIWSRDLDAIDATNDIDPGDLAPQSLDPKDRRALVRQTSDVRIALPPQPLDVKNLALSSLGAWVDWHGAWDVTHMGPLPAHTAAPDTYRHQATMGRDQYVRLTYPGFLYPFGHRAVWVKITERRIDDRADAVAALWQRFFILVREPVRTYPGHDSPWAQVVVEPLVTPDLDAHTLDDPFVPTRNGNPFAFSLIATDRAGGVSAFAAPLVFVPFESYGNPAKAATIQTRVEGAYAPVEVIPGLGQKVALAQQATGGDTALETNALVFHGVVNADQGSSTPSLTRVNAVVPSMRHLAPQAPGVDLVYSTAFLGADAAGFGAANPSQLFLALSSPAPAVDFSGGSDRSGGFLAPNLKVRALSRSLGAVGEDGTKPDSGLAQGQFNPASFLEGALPKLFGLFSLVDLLDAVGISLDKAPKFVTEALDAVSAIVSEADRLRSALEQLGPRLDDEISRAAHDGAKGQLQALKSQLDAVATPLLTALTHLLDTVAALPDAADIPSAVTAVTTALTDVADQVDAFLGLLGAPQLPAVLRAELQRPSTALAALAKATDTLEAIKGFAESLLSPGTAITARFDWRPELHSWPDVPGKEVFKITDKRCLHLAVEVRASATTPPSVDVAAEITNFSLVLLPGAQLMGLAFSRIGFRVSSGGKPEVDVVFDGIEFLGPLSFIDTLRRMIPFDGFSDPPFVDVSPEGVSAGFDLALPSIGVGVFSLENISLGADARVPFLGDAVSVGFHFCSKDSPFRLTVMCVGGGGWVELRASPKGMVLLEMGLEACACLSIDLGVASGSVSISVGVYLRLEADKGLLTAYFRIRGEVDVLGLISASITLELSLTYHFETGKLVGRASLVVEVEVLFFSASVEIVVERKLAGSKGDPVLAQILPPEPDGTNADWTTYCEAFAPLP